MEKHINKYLQELKKSKLLNLKFVFVSILLLSVSTLSASDIQVIGNDESEQTTYAGELAMMSGECSYTMGAAHSTIKINGVVVESRTWGVINSSRSVFGNIPNVDSYSGDADVIILLEFPVVLKNYVSFGYATVKSGGAGAKYIELSGKLKDIKSKSALGALVWK